MEENPFRSPETTASARAGSGAAIGMMVFSALWLIMIVLGFGRLLVGAALLADNPLGPLLERRTTAIALAVWVVVLLAANAVVLHGANQMRTGGSRRWAWAACLISCIPFLSSCYFFGIPFGIWGVIALLRARD